jgi:outer membrane protein TolC
MVQATTLKRRRTRCGILSFAILCPIGLAAQQPVSLDSALREARVANAQLPVAEFDVRIARTLVNEAQASRRPQFSVQSGLSTGAPLAYASSQGQVQLVGSQTLFAGGLRRANINAANFRVAAASAGYRMTQKDVDLDVRLRFAELLRADQEIAFRQEGINRLQAYLAQIVARRAAGQPVGGDVLTTQVRLGSEQAVLADAQRTRDEARLQLNDLLGRDPVAPLTLVPLPAPTPPEPPADTPWLSVPDVAQAAATRSAAEAEIAAARAERRPQVSIGANLGALPVFGTDAGTALNTGSGFGGAVVLSLSMPVWDAGLIRAHIDRAEVQALQARGSEIVAQRQSRLSWQLANADRIRLYEQVQIWAGNIPLARDAYLQAASMYAGGTATALEVLDAYAAWIAANESYADVVLQYRQSEANALRWGTP